MKTYIKRFETFLCFPVSSLNMFFLFWVIIMETEMKYKNQDVRPKVNNSDNAPTPDDEVLENETTRENQRGTSFRLDGSFSGTVDAEEYENAYIRGTVDPTAGKERRTHVYRLSTNDGEWTTDISTLQSEGLEFPDADTADAD